MLKLTPPKKKPKKLSGISPSLDKIGQMIAMKG